VVEIPEHPDEEHVAQSTTMFNILIKSDEAAWETDQLTRMRVGRFKDYEGYSGSGSEAEDISS